MTESSLDSVGVCCAATFTHQLLSSVTTPYVVVVETVLAVRPSPSQARAGLKLVFLFAARAGQNTDLVVIRNNHES